MEKNEIAKKDVVINFIDEIESGVVQALPTHVTKVAFCRALQTSLRKNPKLMQCTKQSLSSTVMDSAQFGLTIGYTAHLIPYGKECTLIIDYKGLIDMAYRNERVQKIMADVICENDDFDYPGYGKPTHKKDLRSRGKEYAAYAYCELEGCPDPMVVVMSHDEIEKVRKSSKAGRNGPWVDWWGEMAKKTCIKRLCKIIPKSIELQSAMEYEDRKEREIRETEAKVIDDTLTPGRHTRKSAYKTMVMSKENSEPTPEVDEDKKQQERIIYLGGAKMNMTETFDAALKEVNAESIEEVAADEAIFNKVKSFIKANEE